MAVRPFVSVEDAVEALIQERQSCAKDRLKRPSGQDLVSWPQSGGFQVCFSHLPAPVEIERIRERLTDELEQKDAEGNHNLPVKRIEFHTRTGVIRVVADKLRQHLMR